MLPARLTLAYVAPSGLQEGSHPAVSRRDPTIKAIPTTYRGVAMRSRLEARWASMFDALPWHWEYEPDLQVGFVLPDFLLPRFAHPVVIECKPAITPDELAEHRRLLIGKMQDWLLEDVLREIQELDGDLDQSLGLTDQALNDLTRIACGNNPRGRTRRVLVVGPCLHLEGGAVTIDGEHGFCLCCAHGVPKHVGLTTQLGTPCLLCGEDSTAWMPEETMLNAWRDSQNIVQWKPA